MAQNSKECPRPPHPRRLPPTLRWPWLGPMCGPGPLGPLPAAASPPRDPSGPVMRALGPTGWYRPPRELRVVRSQRRSGWRVAGAPSRTLCQTSGTGAQPEWIGGLEAWMEEEPEALELWLRGVKQ